ncbi:FdhE protein [Desulfonatronum thiosulfatophilum]|uniref:FdhE protein n=1 Tax=Desulfonatronum thiosulfatophilum TaxID=617002 RepID=A0A1G6CWE8_9BACT|nr:formate dehydrogenase accessory protein FdhE [Desulfonatronum thiosulfatophilum]SDB37015.1 FdhE protein [Desulfonatronum thiosulfatophilum]
MRNLEKDQQHFTKKMASLRKKGTFPGALLDLLEKVSAKQFQVLADSKHAEDSASSLPELASPERHSQGASLLPRASFPFPLESASELMKSILEDVQAVGSDLGEGAVRVKDALDSEELEFARIFQAYLDEEQDFFNIWAEKTPKSPKLLLFLTQTTLAPFLQIVARQIQDARPLTGVWNHGHCPVCGSLPYISTLETREGMRMMHCCFCQTHYRVARLGCIYCGERDPKKLHYFETEEEPGFRVDLCDQCKMYIKTMDFRTLDRISVPVLDDLESLAMDVLAQAKGHVRPTVSAYGF